MLKIKRMLQLQKSIQLFRNLLRRKVVSIFNSVSIESGVSKTYLYNNSDVRERIDTLRRQQEGLPSPKLVKREMSDASKDVLIAAKNKRIKELEEENKNLKNELMKLRGIIYEHC